jgi:hypothetical protein
MPNTATQYCNPLPTNQSNPEFNLCQLIRRIHFRKDISANAKLVATHLLMSAGRRGFIEDLSMRQLSFELGDIPRSSLHNYVNELISVGFLQRIEHIGRPNTWIIVETRKLALADPSSSSDTKIKSSKKKTYQSQTADNVVSNQSEEPIQSMPTNKTTSVRANPIRMDIVSEIVSLTCDKKSLGCWVKFVKHAPLAIVYAAISSLKIAIDEGIVEHPGRYMVGIIRNIYPELFSSPTIKHQGPPSSIYSRPEPVEPEIQPDIALNMEQLRRIRQMLDAK